MKTRFTLLWLLALAACIPVLDRFDPVIAPLQVRNVYNIQDTIRLGLTFLDNEQLDSAVISIRPVVPSATNSWEPNIIVRPRGRRFEDTVRIGIPPTAPLGNYEMQLILFDRSKNAAQSQYAFQLQGDNRPPEFRSFGLLGLPRDAAGNFVVCRQSVINLTGLAADNVRLREIRATIPNVLNVTRSIGRDTVSLAGIFGRDLRIPDNVADNARLALTITLVDAANNTVSRTVNLVVNCDDQPPRIQVLRTTPAINASNEATVIEGTSFRINAASLSDNRRLARVAVTFNLLNQRRDTVFRAALNTPTADLGALLRNTSFNLNANAQPGNVFEVVIFATDSAGNAATPTQLLLNVTKDEPPIIVIAEARIQGNRVNLIEGQTLPIQRGAALEIAGKIEEDRALEYVQIFWGLEQREAQVVSLLAADLTALPFDFADPRSVNTFRVPSSAAPGSVYVLQIRVKDVKNTEVRRTYRFTVSQ